GAADGELGGEDLIGHGPEPAPLAAVCVCWARGHRVSPRRARRERQPTGSKGSESCGGVWRRATQIELSALPYNRSVIDNRVRCSLWARCMAALVCATLAGAVLAGAVLASAVLASAPAAAAAVQSPLLASPYEYLGWGNPQPPA